MSNDIIERKRIEKALQESEKKYRLLIDTANESVVVAQDGLLKFVNPMTLDLLGVDSEQDLIDRPFAEFIHPDDRNMVVENCRRLVANETVPSRYVFRVVTREGIVKWVEINGALIEWQGKPATLNLLSDITERKLAANEVKAIKTQMEFILGATKTGLDIIDAKFNIHYIDPEWKKVYGDYAGHKCYQYFMDRNTPCPDCGVVKAIQTKSITVTEEVLLKENSRPIQVTTIPFQNDAGEWLVAEVNVDITERKRTEDILKKSEERYRTIFENAAEGIFQTSIQGRLLQANPALAKMFGFASAEEMIANITDLGTQLYARSEDRERLRRLIAEHDQVENFEAEGRTRYGQSIWVLINIHAVRDQIGSLLYLEGTNIDITARKQMDRELRQSKDELEAKNILLTEEIAERKGAEKALRESEEKFRNLFNNASDAIFIHDLEGHFFEVNQAACDSLGYTRDELVKMTPEDLDPPDVAALVPGRFEEIIRVGNKVFESVQIRRDGSIMPCEMNARLIDYRGTKAILAIVRDITERKKMENELHRYRDELEQRVKERTAELEARNAEMERFVYTVSHELRTPLVSVSGILGFIEQDAQNGDLDRMQADLRIANESVSRMDRLLLETLELSRIGRVVNPPEDVPFGEIVEDALGQTSDKIRSKGLKISVAQDLPVVYVDRMRIAEVLVNLIENSMKYMGLQANPEIEIGQRIDGKDRIFFVRDNGIGIDPSQFDKVFELFYKVHKQSEGSGAGLAIVKRIIEVHGGRIWIESELGEGCAVCFTLPLA